MSFAFRALDDEWRIDERGMPIREVLDATLSEVSVVAFHAYPQTSISAGPEGHRSLGGLRTKAAEITARAQGGH